MTRLAATSLVKIGLNTIPALRARIGRGAALAAILSAAILSAAGVQAQGQAPGQPDPAAPPAGPVGAQTKPRPPAKAAARAPAKTEAVQAAAPVETSGPSTAQLRQRIEQLEEQINEMHVAVGTLDSLAKVGAGRAPSSPTAAPGSAGNLSADAARLDGMENRLRALSGQIEQMALQIRALEGRGGGRLPQDRSEAAPPPRTAEVNPAEPPAGERSDAIGGLIRGPGSDRSADVGAQPLPPIAGGALPRQQPAYQLCQVLSQRYCSICTHLPFDLIDKRPVLRYRRL